MKKVTIFIGSPQKRGTYQSAQEFVENLKSLAEVDCEYVFLKDYNLENCKGCKTCFEKGEEFCPWRDDRDLLIEKLNNSDGVIFATPNYSFQVAVLMKTFLERLAFVFHRPRYFGKAFTAIVSEGIYGGAAIVKYLEFAGGGLGFNVARGCYLTAFEPRTAIQQKKITQKIKKASSRFYKVLMHPTPPAPSLLKLVIFRLSRTSIRAHLDEKDRDYRYYQEKGWFVTDYYYDASLGFAKKLTGRVCDFLGERMARRNLQKEANNL